MSSFRGLESGEDRGVLSKSWLSRQDLGFHVEIAPFGEISPVSVPSKNLASNLAEMEEATAISARSR